MWRPSTLAKRFSRAQALPAEPGDRDKFSAVISGGWEDRCDIGHLATNILGRNLEGQIDDLNPVTSENPGRAGGEEELALNKSPRRSGERPDPSLANGPGLGTTRCSAGSRA